MFVPELRDHAGNCGGRDPEKARRFGEASRASWTKTASWHEGGP